MLAGIIGAIESTLFRLDDRINAIGIGPGNGDADLAENTFGKTVPFEMFPCDAVILRAIKSAAWAATGKKPWLPPCLPKRCEDDVRIMRIENNVDPACIFVFR